MQRNEPPRCTRFFSFGSDGSKGVAGPWARDHDLPYFEGHVHLPDFRIEYELNGRDRHEDVEVMAGHYRGAHAASRGRAGFTCIRASTNGKGTPFSPREW